MKNLLLVSIILLASTISFGQTESLSAKQKTLFIDGININKLDVEYIEIACYTTWMYGKKWAVTFDLGEEYVPQKGHKYKDENGQIVDFRSPMHAVNYLCKCGWEYVDQTGGTANNATGIFIMMHKKKVL